MFYRVHADLSFTDPDEANDFYHDCELACRKAQIINPGATNQESGHIQLEKCFHDETPNLPCILLEEAYVGPPIP